MSAPMTGPMVVVMTGASRGIGRAVAEDLVADGHTLVINGRDPATLDATVADLRSRGGEVVGVAGSAADPAVVKGLAEAADELGGAAALINLAGVAEPAGSSILNVTDAEWTDLIDTHLHATFRACREFAPRFVTRGGGAIVNTASHAFTGLYGGTGYAAGKGAVVSLTYALAAELAEHHVRVNAVCPGARTRLSEGPEYERHIDQLHRRGLLDDMMRDASLAPADPSHVTAVYRYLIAADTTLTGEVITAAGGYIGRFPRPADRFVAWRDHTAEPPWTVAEVAALLADHDPAE